MVQLGALSASYTVPPRPATSGVYLHGGPAVQAATLVEKEDAASIHFQLTCKPLQDYVYGVLVVESLLHSLSAVDADDNSPGI